MRDRLKYFVVILISFILLDAAPSELWAAGPATHCIVSVKGLKLKDMDNAWIEVPIQETTIDLGKPDQTIVFKNDGRVPEGMYKNFKLIISETIEVSGQDGGNFTTEGGELTLGGTAYTLFDLPGDITSITESKTSWNTITEGNMKIKINFDFEDRDDVMEVYGVRDLEKPFRVKASTTLTFAMVMSVSQTVYFAWPDSLAKDVPSKNVMYFLPADRITEVSIKADSYTASFEPEFINIAF